MITPEQVRQLALTFPNTTEEPHFEKTSFRVKKKIFATMQVDKKLVCLLLSEVDQSVFCGIDPKVIYPVPNKWGKGGATYVELDLVDENLFRDALMCAYETRVAKK